MGSVSVGGYLELSCCGVAGDDGGASFHFGGQNRLEFAGESLRVDGDKVESENGRSVNGEVGSWKAEPSRSGVYFRLQHSNFKLPLGSHPKPRTYMNSLGIKPVACHPTVSSVR